MPTTLACEQAVFTSIRTPTGEGYRIIAASRGLKPEEKQTITRYSPSHDALCGGPQGEAPYGAAFYPLPSGRLCVAYSCLAGAEHTGRGGERVYTYNLVFPAEDFPSCGYNPFAVLRAMSRAGLAEPQLHPPATLPEVSLEITEADLSPAGAELCRAFAAPWRDHCLESLLNARTLVVNLPDRWIETMEAMLIGVPGPMRSRFSFGAGLKFSVGRCHNLALLADDPAATRKKLLGRPIAYVDPGDGRAPNPSASQWVSFVERHWSRADFTNLLPRTSLAFSDTTPQALERIGRLYNETDAVSETETGELIDLAASHLVEPEDGVEADLAARLLLKAQTAITERFRRATWGVLQGDWEALGAAWRRGEEGRLFAQPIIETGLRAVAARDPMVAAEAALGLTRNMPLAAARAGFDDLLDEILNTLAAWIERAPDDRMADVGRLVKRWRAARPACGILDRIEHQCLAGAGIDSRG